MLIFLQMGMHLKEEEIDLVFPSHQDQACFGMAHSK